jgi:Ni/Fe-hydrogenase subunit HybB-like protein
MSARQVTLKSILWGILGILAVVSVARFTRGLGATTGLTDAAPWGFWIAFDVMAGVALAAGGFVMAATVHVFHLEDYKPFVRPAILTALLGYTAVAVGLLYDLGLPWHIWHPIIYPQVHSVLFEVAMCVMLYLSVLFLEFSPVILEHPRFDRPAFRAFYKTVKKVQVPLVISGIVLSTLHQSSLGSLFLITPYRLDPLWYSPHIWVLFFISAIGLGFMTAVLESYFSSWFFGHPLRIKQLAGLARAGSVVLLLYALLRFADLAARDQLAAAFSGTFQSRLLLFEMASAALIPAILLSFRAVRTQPTILGLLAFTSVMGIIGYRFDVCIVAFKRPADISYFPTWMEIAVSAGIVAMALLVFIFAVEHLRVDTETGEDADSASLDGPPVPLEFPIERYSPFGIHLLLPDRWAAPRRYSLAFAGGVALAVSLLPTAALRGTLPPRTPVIAARMVEACVEPRANRFGHIFHITAPAPASQTHISFPISLAPDSVATGSTTLLLLDGNRDHRMVAFPHDRHTATLGGEQSCAKCHHLDLPFRSNSGCYACHQDMYEPSDIFGHSSHIAHLPGAVGCTQCHPNDGRAKTRASTKSCRECHADMYAENSRVAPPKEGMTGIACGYMDAMHKLCLDCHQERVVTAPDQFPEEFAECANCHRGLDGFRIEELGPYAPTSPAPASNTMTVAALGSAGSSPLPSPLAAPQ